MALAPQRDSTSPSQASAEAEELPLPVLMKGNEAIAEAAIRAGCQAYFGYPITPQTELLEYMARRMPELGRVFVQAESEPAAISMVMGAAAAGVRAMTSSSGPGISLMQEGISYLIGCELPAVVVDVMRNGPGLGGVLPAQADYGQATRGGGHGDGHLLVLAPASVQEAMDLTELAFELADSYRNPAMVLADGLIGQVMEPVVVRAGNPGAQLKLWALTGASGRPKNTIKSLRLQPEAGEAHNLHLAGKYARMAADEARHAGYLLEDAEAVVVAYGTPSRVARTAVRMARDLGIRAGLFRPITLFPFPYRALREVASSARAVLVVELSMGQLLEDVRLALGESVPIALHARTGGMVPTPPEVCDAIKELVPR